MNRFYCFILLLFIFSTSVLAQETDSSYVDDFYNMSLEEIMAVKITVDSKFEYEKKESPSINTVITSEEITLMGARNLMDVLQTVPGMSISVGGVPYYGLNIRGNASNFGKVLVLIDGEIVNESMFGLAHVGDRINIRQIERIEIIQGPGGALYGGWAEFGVVNIITKKKVSGVSFISGLDQYQLSYKGGAYINEEVKGLSIAASMYSGTAQIRKDTIYSFPLDTSVYQDVYNERPLWFSLGLAYKGFYAKYLFDGYKTDAYVLPGTIVDNSAINFDLEKTVVGYKKEFKNSAKFDVKLDVTNQKPFNYTSKGIRIVKYTNNQIRAQSTYQSSFSKKLKWLVGVEAFRDYGDYENDFDSSKASNSYNTFASFFSLDYRYKDFLATVGVRYIYNSVYKSAISPRISLRYSRGVFYAKTMLNSAYRPPAIGELFYTEGLKPEKTNSLELQVGMDKPKFKTSLSYFIIKNYDAISYTYDVKTDQQLYKNNGTTGTSGIEGELRWVYNKFLSFNFNFSQVLKNHNKIEEYDAGDGLNRGIPLTTVYSRASYMIFPEFYVTPSYQYIGKVRAVLNKSGLQDIPPLHLFNCNLSYSQRKENMRITYGLGVFNIFNTTQYYHTTYPDLGTSLPANHRQLVISLDVEF